jgi:hypothetical protein
MAATHKLILDDFSEDNFELIAVHTTLDLYRIAYFINKTLKLRLHYKLNLDSFDVFEYEDINTQEIWSLVANKGEVLVKKNKTDTINFGGKRTSLKTYLIPEYKNVDCFLKVENCTQNSKNILSKIGKITQVITAFSIDANQLKSKNNLIFN